MQPVKFVDVPAGRVVGVQRRVELQTADWSGLWDNDYMPRMADVDARGEGDPCCGYYFGTDVEGVVDFVMGKPARADAQACEGLVIRDAPAAHYAVFECGMSSASGCPRRACRRTRRRRASSPSDRDVTRARSPSSFRYR